MTAPSEDALNSLPRHPAAGARGAADGVGVPSGGPIVIVADSISVLVDRARELISPGTRRILGIAGAPGSGKSTVAEALCTELGSDAALVQLDGFHLDNVALTRLGLRDRKGAADTFDVYGFVALLRRLHLAEDPVVYAPEFRREIETAVSAVVPVPRGTPLVVVEGNYLLLDTVPWRQVRGLLDEVWYLALDPVVRHDRLVQRHCSFGRSAADAEEWVRRVDDADALQVAGTRGRADVLMRVDALAL